MLIVRARRNIPTITWIERTLYDTGHKPPQEGYDITVAYRYFHSMFSTGATEGVGTHVEIVILVFADTYALQHIPELTAFTAEESCKSVHVY